MSRKSNKNEGFQWRPEGVFSSCILPMAFSATAAIGIQQEVLFPKSDIARRLSANGVDEEEPPKVDEVVKHESVSVLV